MSNNTSSILRILAYRRDPAHRYYRNDTLYSNLSNLLETLVINRRVKLQEVPPPPVTTNKRFEAQWERDRLRTERAIARQSNPTVAARLQSQSARTAERQRRTILSNTARGR